MHLRRWGGLMLALALLPAGGVDAQPRPADREETRALLERFDDALAEIDRLLVADRTGQAARKLERLRREMVKRFMSGSGIAAYLARMSALRAVLAYRSGRPEEAVWHWHVALQLHPPISELSFLGHEEAGEFLAAHPPRSAEEDDDETVDGTDLVPPVVRKKPRPEFPWGRLGTGTTPVVVRVVIAEDGSLYDPVVVESGGEPTMAYVALDALRQWEFTPARLHGEPIDAYYQLQVNFRSGR